MAIPLSIKGTTYQYAEAGDDPGWGAENTDWAQAVTDVLNTLVSENDILETTATIQNNILVPIDINQLLFDPGSVRAANIDYAIYRSSTSTTSGYSESGSIHITYDDNASVGAKWILNARMTGFSGVVFSILDNGQIQYTSSDIGSLGYSGKITFQAKTLSR